MKRNPILIGIACLFPLATLSAQEPPLRELLRDGLYAEEVTRDPEAAAKQYEQVLARHSEQRAFASSALFRLAEVRRKQGRKEDAVKLYQQLLAEFPADGVQTRLARENLLAMGAAAPVAGAPADNPQTQELARLEAMSKTAPDIILDPMTLYNAVNQGWAEAVKFLLAAGSYPYAEDVLPRAALKGNLEIVRQLTDNEIPVPGGLAAKTLQSAIEANRLTILEFLLQKGFKPGSVDGVPLLGLALQEEKLQAAEILLRHGADLNAMSEVILTASNEHEPIGTQLHRMIAREKFGAANWLLEKGAKPDIPNHFGIAPLHYAAGLEAEGCLEIMEKLLVAGADPNRLSAGRKVGGRPKELSVVNATPLKTAILSRYKPAEKVRLLLKHRADPSIKDPAGSSAIHWVFQADQLEKVETLQLLIRAGASAKEPDLLGMAIESKEHNLQLLGLLLDAGADPGAEYQYYFPGGSGHQIGAQQLVTPLRHAAQKSDGLPLVELLIARGAKPDPEWLKFLMEQGQSQRSGMQATGSSAVRLFLFRKFVYPLYTAKKTVLLAIHYPDGGGSIRELEIATHAKEPGDPAAILLAQAFRWPVSNDEWPDKFTRWRMAGDGQWEGVESSLSGSAPLPDLKWGDTLEFRIGPMNGSNTQLMSPALAWALRKRVNFPVTLEIEGKTREILLKGSLLAFDPTKNEAPWLAAGELMRLLWQPTDRSTPWGTVIVKREGWADVRVEVNHGSRKDFPLEKGDRLVLEPAPLEGAGQPPKQHVVLKVRDVPFAVHYGAWSETDGKPAAPGFPTLVQAITDAYAPWRPQDFGPLPVAPEDCLAVIAALKRPTPAIPPHPDFSKIRIRRLDPDEKETWIAVDLAAAIARCTEATAVEEAREADIVLQPGDTVELPLHKDRLDQPWTGFTEQENLFFRKVLSGSFQVEQSDGQVERRDFTWQAPAWLSGEAGLLPLPPPGGAASARLSWQELNRTQDITRDGIPYPEVSIDQAFLKDGDQLKQGDQGPRPRPPRRPVQPPSH